MPNISSQSRWVLFIDLLIIRLSIQSIAGVTYMDHFDFEERYRNIHECDPFYWHPLHLPEECAEMYEKLIRSRIAAHQPVHVVKEREEEIAYEFVPNHFPTYYYKSEIGESYDRPHNYAHKMTPYEKMLDLLRKDVMNVPRAPTITIMPNLGPVALYRQPISRRSEKMIKKIAEAYINKEHDENNDEIEMHTEKFYDEENQDNIVANKKMMQKIKKALKGKKTQKGKKTVAVRN